MCRSRNVGRVRWIICGLLFFRGASCPMSTGWSCRCSSRCLQPRIWLVGAVAMAIVVFWFQACLRHRLSCSSGGWSIGSAQSLATCARHGGVDGSAHVAHALVTSDGRASPWCACRSRSGNREPIRPQPSPRFRNGFRSRERALVDRHFQRGLPMSARWSRPCWSRRSPLALRTGRSAFLDRPACSTSSCDSPPGSILLPPARASMRA